MSLAILKGICESEVKALSMLTITLSDKIISEGAGGDYTKMIDLVAEEAAISYLMSIGFEGRLLSEEFGEKRFGPADYPLLILDPVDGTTNATRGISFYSISIAALSGPLLSNVYAGVVMELPSGRLFTGKSGIGAHLNDKRIGVKQVFTLKEGLVGIDLNVQGDEQKMAKIMPLCLYAKHVRNMGSAALELCYVASGALDLYADNRGLLRVTDIAASYIILKEAGASILNMQGAELDCNLNLVERVSLIAGAQNACMEALSVIKRRHPKNNS
jgi:myo-inositol-1(or 4)-monophosphatase